MKVRASIRRICEQCRIIRRGGKVHSQKYKLGEPEKPLKVVGETGETDAVPEHELPGRDPGRPDRGGHHDRDHDEVRRAPGRPGDRRGPVQPDVLTAQSRRRAGDPECCGHGREA